MTPGPLIPSNSVEFETITTYPAFGREDVDTTWYEYVDSEGKIHTEPWKMLQFFTKDWRVGNLNPRVHDLNFQWHYLDFAGKLLTLRNGRFKLAFVSALMTVAAISETSQSHGGFFRKNSRTVVQEQTYKDTTPQSGGLANFFRGNKNNGGM